MIDSVVCADALTFLRSLGDRSVDLLVLDPPYFGVKDEDWDNQWLTDDDYLAWIGELAEEWRRVLKLNGSLYCFASPRLAAQVEVEIGKRFNILNNIVWYKTHGNRNWSVDRKIQRSFLASTERIIFAEHLNPQSFLRDARKKAHLSSNEVATLFRSASGGITGLVRNWETGLTTPSREQYAKLRTVLALPDYDDAIRPFVLADAFTDVWDFAPLKYFPGKHPCEKPLGMMRHIVRSSSRPGALVLDCFCGSGSTLRAAVIEGRHYLGCEADAHWAAYARKFLSEPFTETITDNSDMSGLPLFGGK